MKRIIRAFIPACVVAVSASLSSAQTGDISATIARSRKTLDEIDRVISNMDARRSAEAKAAAEASAATRMSATAAPVKTAEALMADINSWYSDQLKKAREEKKTPDFNALLAERTARAKRAVAGIDPASQEPRTCYAWGQLFQAAGMQKEMLAAAQRYVAVETDPTKKYAGQQMALTGLQAQGDADGIVKVLAEMKPATPAAAASLASMTAAQYARTVADVKGVKAGLDLISRAEAAVPFEQLRKDEAARAAAQRAQNAQNPQAAAVLRNFSQADATIATIAQGRSALLEKDGKAPEAQAVLEAAVKKLGPGNTYARSIESKLKLSRLAGSAAPELKSERGYGGFSSLAALKGKVVMLDFTAHW